MLLRFVDVVLLLSAFKVFSSGSSTTESYDLCKTGPVITGLNGVIYATIGIDCNRIILAPQGYRIEVNVTENTNILEEIPMDIFDGATAFDNSNRVKISRHRSDMDHIIVSSSNAVVIHIDKITSRSTNVEIIYRVFKHPPERCQCLPVTHGETTCSFSFHFIRDDNFARVCNVDCGPNRFIANRGFTGDFRMQCYLGDPKYNKGNESSWKASWHLERLLDDQLITCARIYPTTKLKLGYKFSYINVSCEQVNETALMHKIRQYISSVGAVANASQCFKTAIPKENINCSVKSINMMCKPSGRSARVVLTVRDNVMNSTNETIVFQRFFQLYSQYLVHMINQRNLLAFINHNLTVNGTQATGISYEYGIQGIQDCPENAVIKLDYTNSKFRYGCLNCPPNFYRTSNIFYCQRCKNGTRRNNEEATCVRGARIYPEPSQKYCKHTCDLGKYFNHNSSICEWCPYGTYQNSTTTPNPRCTPCPGELTTGFIGARNISECINLCPAGSYLKYTRCLQCEVGYFMPNASNRLLNCYQCTNGYTTLGVATVDGCVEKCTAGEYFNVTVQNCILCPNNTYQDEVNDTNTRTCKKCPRNTITAQTGSTAFSDCLGPCNSGEYIDAGIQKCSPCIINTYQDEAQHVSLTCKVCGPHKITLKTGSTDVSECIYPCSKGEFFNKTGKVCEQCRINTYQDELGKDDCKSCQGNTFTVKTGSENCITPCGFGEFLNISAEKCMKCLKGFYQNISEYTSEICQPCPIDFYSDKTGQPNCTACKNGSITLVTAATSVAECIKSCETGHYLNKTLRSCQKCSKGFYQDKKGYRDEFCTKCKSANVTTLEDGARSSDECVGYCESSPCFNGAICSNIDNDFNCSCPKFLTGKQCGVVIDRNSSDTMEILIRFPNLVWGENLQGRESDEFKELALRIENIIREEFETDPTFRTVKVVGFSRGSVVSKVQFTYVGGVTFVTPVDKLTEVISNGSLGNYLTVDVDALNIINYTCSQPLGMENRRIPDSAITSGITSFYYPPKNARLNHPGPGYAPLYFDDKDYLQVDFLEELWLSGIATQGSSYEGAGRGGGSWLQTFYIETSSNGQDWSFYVGDYIRFHLFLANSDVDTVVRNTLPYPVKTRYVRIYEYHFKNWISFRVEFYGCPIPKTLPLPTQTLSRTPTADTKPPTTGTNTTYPSSTAVTPDDDDGENVGLIVGVTIAVCAVCVIVVSVVWKLTQNRKSHSMGGPSVGAMQLRETK